MYIINRHGILHSAPDDMRLPSGARKATAAEIGEWQAQDAANKAALRAQKQASAQARAQLVIVHPSDPSSAPITPITPITAGGAQPITGGGKTHAKPTE